MRAGAGGADPDPRGARGLLQEARAALQQELFRVDAMLAPGHMNKKIKEAQGQKVPFMLIAGEREAADGTVAVRRRDTREQEVVPFEQFLELIKRLRSTRALDLGQPLVKS
ncbi:MAG: hypothetical protein IPJ19_11570 [Planctomycetes bacterium]|nr:hypothetical protein [Planctomycetota bacterium]